MQGIQMGANNWIRQESKAILSLDGVLNPYGMNKLCARFDVTSSVPVKYSYSVTGKTADTSFTYSGDAYLETFSIPVIGLYANDTTRVNFVFEDETGLQETYFSDVDTTGQDYGDTLLTIAITVHDQTIADATIGQGWIMDAMHNCYDKNGDIRLTGLNVGNQSALTIHNGYVYVMSEAVNQQYNAEFYQCNLMGQTFKTFTAPEGFAFHHDCTFKGDEYLYAPASTLAAPTDSAKVQCLIMKFDMETTELVWQRDYSTEFMQQSILENGDTNDVHFNALCYIDKLSQLLVNSRACSAMLGLDPDSGDILWLIDDPANKVIDETLNLTVSNPDQFIYPNGEHATFPTQNSKYATYRDGENRLAISMFDNKSCMDANGASLERVMETPQGSYESYPFDSPIFVMGIDLTERTVAFLDEFTIPGQRSEFMSSVYDIGEYFSYNNTLTTEPSNFFVLDTNNTIGVETKTMGSYRARILTYDQIRALI